MKGYIEHLSKDSEEEYVAYTKGYVDKNKFLKEVIDETGIELNIDSVKCGYIVQEYLRAKKDYSYYIFFFEEEKGDIIKEPVTYIEY